MVRPTKDEVALALRRKDDGDWYVGVLAAEVLALQEDLRCAQAVIRCLEPKL